MMKIAVFSTKPYDREFLARANDSQHELRFFEPRLTNETVSLATGFEAVCVFVNDRVDAAVIATLASLGIRLVALRCAGYSNVDLVAAKKHRITVVRVPGYSPYAVAEHTIGLNARAESQTASRLQPCARGQLCARRVARIRYARQNSRRYRHWENRHCGCRNSERVGWLDPGVRSGAE